MSWLDKSLQVATGIPGAYRAAVAGTTDWLGGEPSVADPATAPGGSPLYPGDPAGSWATVGQTIGDLGRGVAQETAMGLFDASGQLDVGGLLDRQDAQRDLSDRFQVVPEASAGDASNRVTQDEYEAIARQFSDIRRGTSDLKLDGAAAGSGQPAWEAGIQASIADLMMTDVGRAQIDTLADNQVGGHARTTTIQPRVDKTGALDNSNAHVDAPGGDLAATMRGPNGEPGVGFDASVFINPGIVGGLRSDVMLAHELPHATSVTQGTSASGWFNGGGIDRGNAINAERQAVGLSRSDAPDGRAYPGEEGGNENAYRLARNELGDRLLPRTSYRSSTPTIPGEAPASMSDGELGAAWLAHNLGPDVPMFQRVAKPQ